MNFVFSLLFCSEELNICEVIYLAKEDLILSNWQSQDIWFCDQHSFVVLLLPGEVCRCCEMLKTHKRYEAVERKVIYRTEICPNSNPTTVSVTILQALRFSVQHVLRQGYLRPPHGEQLCETGPPVKDEGGNLREWIQLYFFKMMLGGPLVDEMQNLFILNPESM